MHTVFHWFVKFFNISVYKNEKHIISTHSKSLIYCWPKSVFFPLIKVSPQFLKKRISSLKPLILRIYKLVLPSLSFSLIELSFQFPVVGWMHLLEALGLQACRHPPKEKRKESAMRAKEREESTKGKVFYSPKKWLPS